MEEEFEFDEEKQNSSIFRKIFFLLILIILLLIIYARFFGTTGLIIKDYNVSNENMNESFNGFKIVHFSDLHYGRTINKKELNNVVKKINLLKPDIVIFTGDLINKDVSIKDSELLNIINELSKINSIYGKYYVTGDHDTKNNDYEKIMNDSGFTNINDNYKIITNKNNDSILISGINYKSTGDYLEELFKNNLPSYKIMIMHTPDTFDNIKKYNFNLVLAGHSLNGQINLPFIGAVYSPKEARNYYKEYYKIDNTDFYISSGIGTNSFNYRLLNRPSINIYRLKN